MSVATTQEAEKIHGRRITRADSLEIAYGEERFLSAQADPSREVKGKRKSACSVRNDVLCVALGRG